MKRIVLILIIIFAIDHFDASANAGFCLIPHHDSIPLKNNTAKLQAAKKRTRTILISHALIYTGTFATLYQTWYKDYPRGSFRSFDDMDEWMQMDKIGHSYTAYAISRGSGEMWRHTTLTENQRIWVGGLSGALYQTILETLDAFSTQWGWSWGDVAGNLAGSALYLSQELQWKDQRLQLKTSFHKKTYADAILNERSDKLFGKSLAERCLKDYNGQTYWLSGNLHAFFPHSKIPSWLQIAVGTGVEGVFGARSNKAFDPQGQIIFDRSGVARTRQWYLAPDVDFTKIKTNNRWVRTLLFLLNSFKFPAPGLEYSKTGLKLRWMIF